MDAKVYVVCMDEFTRVILERLSLSQVVTVPLHSIEENDSRLLAARHDRTAVEYLWTLTPTIILRLLERFSEVEILTYVDADMFFYSSSEDLFKEFGDSSVLIHEHRFPQAFAHLKDFGTYNVGIMAFRRDERGFKVLKWWRERCLEWCKATLEEGKYGDQKYLDSWPALFEGVVVTQNIGIGVAPWNHCQYLFQERDKKLWINDRQLMIYHFHAFHVVNEAVIVPVGITEYLTPLSYFHTALPPYLDEFSRSIDVARSVYPDFSFGLQKPDFTFLRELSLVIRTSAVPQLDASVREMPHQAISPDWTLFPGTRTM